MIRGRYRRVLMVLNVVIGILVSSLLTLTGFWNVHGLRLFLVYTASFWFVYRILEDIENIYLEGKGVDWFGKKPKRGADEESKGSSFRGIPWYENRYTAIK